MKKIIYIAAIIGAIFLTTFAIANATTTLFPSQGGTGTSITPSYGEVLVGNSDGTYTPTATSSLGITAASSTLLTDNNTFSGTNAFATTTAGSLNGVISVSGWPYAQNSTGIQEAINSCAESSSCGEVYFPAGNYDITTNLTLGGRNNISLIGAGASSTIFSADPAMSDAYIIDDTSPNYQNIQISGIAFNNAAKSQTAAIRLGQISNAYITNDAFENITASSAIWGVKIGPSSISTFNSSQYATNIHFNNNQFTNDNFGTEEGLLAVQWQNSTINNNYVTTSTSSNAYILLCYTYCDGVQMNGNQIYNGGGNAIAAQQSTGIQMDNNTIIMTGSGYRALTTVNVTDTQLKNNIIDGSGTGSAGVFVFDRSSGADGNQDLYATTTNLDISGNTIDGTQSGIEMTTGGTGYNNAQSNINIYDNTLTNIGDVPIDIGYNATNGNVFGPISIYNNRITNWEIVNGANVGAIRVTGSSGTSGTMSAVQIYGNYISPTSASEGSAISVVYANPILISNNYVVGDGVGGQPIFSFTNGTETVASAQAIYGNIEDSTSGFTWSNNTGTQEAYVNSSGFLGLGTSNPLAKLHVSGGAVLLSDGQSFEWGAGPGDTRITGSQSSGYITFTVQNAEVGRFNGADFGIGTTSPSTILSLAGTSGIYASTTATSTFQGGGINLTTAAGNTGCFAVNGTCLTNGSGTVTSVTAGTGLSGGTITTSGTLALASIAANSVLANQTNASAVPTALATSSLYNFTGTGNVVQSASPTLTGTVSGSSLFFNASSTIGSGAQNAGLTISGGATTTGNQYIAGTLGIASTSPALSSQLAVVGSAYITGTLNLASNPQLLGSATELLGVSTGGVLEMNGASPWIALGLQQAKNTTGTVGVNISALTFNGSSGQVTAVEAQPTINQSSTAGFTAFVVDPVETAKGSGTNTLFGVGTSTAPTTYLDLADGGSLTLSSGITSSATGDYLCINTSTYVVEMNGSTCTLSSEKVKNSIEPLAPNFAADILNLQPVSFEYDKGFGNPGPQLGLIAEQAASVNPLFAEYADQPMQTPNGLIKVGDPDGINWNGITAALVLEVQQQQKEIDSLSPSTVPNQSGKEQDEIEFLAGFFVLYVLYNEFDKRRRK